MTPFNQQLEILKQKFESSLPTRITTIRIAADMLKEGSENPEELDRFHREVHNLAGSSGSFGFTEIARRATELKESIGLSLNQSRVLDEATLALWRKQADELMPPAENQVLVDINEAEAPCFEPDSPNPAIASNLQKRTIIVLADNSLLGHDISHQLELFGYQTRTATLNKNNLKELGKSPIDVLIIDLDTNIAADGESLRDSPLIGEIRRQFPQTPLIFMSEQDDWHTRLEAFRAGGKAFLNKPLDYSLLTDELDKLVNLEAHKPGRVLIVDDDPVLAKRYALILGSADITCENISSTDDFLQVVTDFKPDLILLDLYMPETSGWEIAGVMRQHPDFIGVHIVFLSSETNRGVQLSALQSGDDFLEKSTPDDHLVTAIQLRLKRIQALGQLMYHDGLTGLLNHIALKLRLDSEIARSQRHKEINSFVMIDIDLFKKVNDSYGHHVGDRVLKALARLLKERLRESDYIGRYGGEEFGVVLPKTSEEEAMQVIDNLRQYFSELIHSADGEEFCCTFSAGVTVFQGERDTQEIIKRADRALYRAKHAGRNQVLACLDRNPGK